MTPAFPLRLHRCIRLLALAILATLIHAGAAWAHASLNASQPADGAVVEAAPQSYSLTFSEPVSPLSLQLVQPDGSAVQLDRFAVKGNSVEIEAPPNLGRGTHVLTWRVVSADGHPVGGSVVFSIGEASAQAPVVEEEIDWTVRGWLGTSKVALYVGLFIGIGGVFARRILMPDADAADRVIIIALAVGAVGAIVSLGFQGLDALGAQAGRLAEPVIWMTGFGTSYGPTVVTALIAFLLAGGALALNGFAAKLAALVAWLLAGIALALSGHASAASPQWLMRPAVFLHVVAIAIWIGALAPLGLALRHTRPGALEALRRFSRAIPLIVAALILAGIVLAVVQLQQPAALLDTAYGQVFLVKLALLVGLFLLAAANRWFLTAQTEAGDTSATRRLVRSIATETLVVLLIFGVAAAWRFTPPPRALAAAAAAPAATHIHTAQVMADLAVTPGRAGPVSVSAMIMTGEFGPLDAKEVTFVFSNPDAGIEPFRRKAEKHGDGTWRVDGITLPLPGAWTVRVDVLISDFEMAKLEGRIVIRP
jgi:copper transport protein